MTRRALLVLSAPPARTGAADWRRFLMIARHFAGLQFQTTALHVSSDRPGAAAMRWLMDAADHVALATPDAAQTAARSLDQRDDYDLVCVLTPDLADVAAGTGRALRVIDLQNPVDEADQETLARRLSSARIVLTAEPPQTKFAQSLDLIAVEAPALITGNRKMRPRLRTPRLLAGIWVERDAVSVAATNALFDEIVARGGGGAPNFAIAGPGAVDIAPPSLPFPVTRLAEDMDETMFYRGLDIAVAPDIEGRAPRLDVVSALECGASPLASSSALNGLRRRWRLPHFRSLGALADFLFERGGELRDGGLLPELRARADWTWSGLVTASARQRERLNREIRANLPR